MNNDVLHKDLPPNLEKFLRGTPTDFIVQSQKDWYRLIALAVYFVVFFTLYVTALVYMELAPINLSIDFHQKFWQVVTGGVVAGAFFTGYVFKNRIKKFIYRISYLEELFEKSPIFAGDKNHFTIFYKGYITAIRWSDIVDCKISYPGNNKGDIEIFFDPDQTVINRYDNKPMRLQSVLAEDVAGYLDVCKKIKKRITRAHATD